MLNTDRLCMGCMNDCGDEQVCAVCGYDNTLDNDASRLPTRIGIADRYIVGRVISSNSEGATYIGWDNSDDSVVNIREYFPAGLSVRNPDKTVSIVKGSEFAFNEGLMEFMEIYRKLVGGELQSVSPVLSVFEENGTAYAVTRPVSGITLEDFLNRNGGSLKWEQARPLFLPLIDTVKGLNDLGIVHGGISPETIIVGRDGKLRITGICISGVRSTYGAIAAHIYSGFAALEQYGGEGAVMTEAVDVYALAAVFFRVLIGITPPSADERANGDKMSIPAHFADELPRQVLVALANGLQIDPKNRTRTVETFKNELVYGETAENARIAAANRKAAEDTASSTKAVKKEKNSGAKYVIISALCTTLAFALIIGILCLTVFRETLFNKDDKNAPLTSDFADAPSVDNIGDYDSAVVDSTKLYDVPDLLGQYYAKIIENEEYEDFKFVIKGKEFSSKYPKGAVCKQSVAAGSDVEKDTTVELIISLGPQEVKVPNVVGLTLDEAKIELLKAGFLYENIDVAEKYDSEAKPNVVIEQTPKHSTSTNTEIVVTVFVNTYTGDTDEPMDDFF